MRDEYSEVSQLIITNKKAEKFLSNDFYKILHLLTGEILYRDCSGNGSKKMLEATVKRKRRLREDTKVVYPTYFNNYYKSCPIVLTLKACKGFIHTNLKELQKIYPDCQFCEFDYIPVSKEEVIKAYGLNIVDTFSINNKNI